MLEWVSLSEWGEEEGWVVCALALRTSSLTPHLFTQSLESALLIHTLSLFYATEKKKQRVYECVEI